MVLSTDFKTLVLRQMIPNDLGLCPAGISINIKPLE